MNAHDLASGSPVAPPHRERAATAETARRQAKAAAERAGVSIRQLRSVRELKAAEEVARAIWGGHGLAGPPVNADLMRALGHSGNYVAGALTADGQLGGVLVGFLGADGDGVHLHSHVLGVLPSVQSRGTGFALKIDQRAWALEQNLAVIRWTFDPLVSRNAYFNLTRLRGSLESYLVNFYGAMGDDLNGDDESDRILVRWDLLSDSVVRAAGGQVVEPGQGAQATVVLREGIDGGPQAGALRDELVALRLPEDIVSLRRRSPVLARRWRAAARGKVREAIALGYECAGVTRAGAYLFQGRGAGHSM